MELEGGRKGHTGEQIAYAIREAQSGTSVAEITRKMGITEQTFYRWKKKYNGLDFTEVRKMKQLQDESNKLKNLVAELSLDKHMLQEVLRKKV